MKNFLKKHQFKIIFLTIFIVLSLLLIPNERKHYLRETVAVFESNYYWKVMGIVSVIVTLAVIFIKKIYQNALNDFIMTSLKLIATCLVFSYLLHNLVLSLMLYTNKLKSCGEITRKYVVIDKIGNYHFIAREVKSQKIITDTDFHDLNQKTAIKDIKTNDTLTIKTYKGIFGIEFHQ